MSKRIGPLGVVLITLGLLAAVACSGTGTGTSPAAEPSVQPSVTVLIPPETDASPSPTENGPTPSQQTEANPTPLEVSLGGVLAISEEELWEEIRYKRISRPKWKTNFRLRTVRYNDFVTVPNSKDGIPAIDDPQFHTVEQADLWLRDTAPVQVVDINGDVRAYPIQVMIFHEVVNDIVGGVPVVITY